MIPSTLSLLPLRGAAVGRTPTILSSDLFCTSFFHSPVFSATGIHWPSPSTLLPRALNISQFVRYAQIPEFPRIDRKRKRAAVPRNRQSQMYFREIELCKSSFFVRELVGVLAGSIQNGEGWSAVGKRSPRPRRAGGKTPPISPWAAYCATSTNSESPHWRRGIVLRTPSNSSGCRYKLSRR